MGNFEEKDDFGDLRATHIEILKQTFPEFQSDHTNQKLRIS